MESFEISALLAGPPERVYRAWLDPRELSALTGGLALVEPVAGGRFVVHDGHVQGQILDLKPYRQIVQTWWTSDAPPSFTDSRLTLRFEPVERGATLVTARHTHIPDGQGRRYRQLWLRDYLEPMRRYFARD